MSTGAGEPLGFLGAVDDALPARFPMVLQALKQRYPRVDETPMGQDVAADTKVCIAGQKPSKNLAFKVSNIANLQNILAYTFFGHNDVPSSDFVGSRRTLSDPLGMPKHPCVHFFWS